jgi:hypothetical protein
MTNENVVHAPERMPESVLSQLVGHNLSPDITHTNLVADECACAHTKVVAQVVSKPPPTPDGGICYNCGNMTVRTGSCMTCTACATTTGCG